ncbi:MAG: AI-2E family transporter [Clostridia bacterium]
MIKLKALLKESKKYILVVIVGILVFELFENLAGVFSALTTLLHVSRSLIIGIILAFIANIPMHFFYTRLFEKIKNEKLRRCVSMTLSFIVILSLLALLLILLIPTFTDSLIKFVSELPGYIAGFNTWLNGIFDSSSANPNLLSVLVSAWDKLSVWIEQEAASLLPSVLTFTFDFLSMLFDFLMGFIVSIFALANKEKLMTIFSRLTDAMFDKKRSHSLKETGAASNEILKKYVSGQFVNMLILMLVIYVMMKIFIMPYPEMVAVIIGFASLIPIIGSWIGTLLCGFFILMIDPMKALWFVIGAAVIQQIIGSVVYPRIVGNAVGLTGFFVILAVLLFGGLFGVIGMLIGVPVMAIIYLLVKKFVEKKETERAKENGNKI